VVVAGVRPPPALAGHQQGRAQAPLAVPRQAAAERGHARAPRRAPRRQDRRARPEVAEPPPRARPHRVCVRHQARPLERQEPGRARRAQEGSEAPARVPPAGRGRAPPRPPGRALAPDLRGGALHRDEEGRAARPPQARREPPGRNDPHRPLLRPRHDEGRARRSHPDRRAASAIPRGGDARLTFRARVPTRRREHAARGREARQGPSPRARSGRRRHRLRPPLPPEGLRLHEGGAGERPGPLPPVQHAPLGEAAAAPRPLPRRAAYDGHPAPQDGRPARHRAAHPAPQGRAPHRLDLRSPQHRGLARGALALPALPARLARRAGAGRPHRSAPACGAFALGAGWAPSGDHKEKGR
jgi:hypothetical protein